MLLSLRYREVHLDFHTSQVCKELGKEFDPCEFARRLKDSKVDSVNIFAKCHHGMSYYPTKIGARHPGLDFDLLGQQIETLHSVGIRCPIYYSVMWDDWAAENHPEWLVVDEESKVLMRRPLSGEWGWSTLDVGSGYGDYVVAQVEEICTTYDVDGFWFDITWPVCNYSPWGMKRMVESGVNAADRRQAQAFAVDTLGAFYARISRLVRSRVPEALIFYNGTITPSMRWALPYMTHLEIESLPTSGEWGYLYYPMFARQARTFGLPILGMTGRFHKSWADFGGLKTEDQLDYECGTILSAGGAVCVGDQLHPSGKLDKAVYRLIAHSFGRIEELEPWLKDAEPTAEVAIQLMDRSALELPRRGLSYSSGVEGAAQILLESAIQFDIVDPEADIDKYRVVILPDRGEIDPILTKKLKSHLHNSGGLLVSGSAGLAGNSFVMDEIPISYYGQSPTAPTYVRPGSTLAKNSDLAADYDYVLYEESAVVTPAARARVFGSLHRALFNRTYRHFTSHCHAPVGEALGAPFAVQKGNVIYIATEIFSAYRNHDYWVYRELVTTLLKQLLPNPLLKVKGPPWVEGSLHVQSRAEDHPARRIVHLVAYQSRRTLQQIPHVDRGWELSGIIAQVRIDGARPSRAYLAPERHPLDLQFVDGYAEVILPPIKTYTVVVIEGGD